MGEFGPGRPRGTGIPVIPALGFEGRPQGLWGISVPKPGAPNCFPFRPPGFAAGFGFPKATPWGPGLKGRPALPVEGGRNPRVSGPGGVWPGHPFGPVKGEGLSGGPFGLAPGGKPGVSGPRVPAAGGAGGQPGKLGGGRTAGGFPGAFPGCLGTRGAERPRVSTPTGGNKGAGPGWNHPKAVSGPGESRGPPGGAPGGWAPLWEELMRRGYKGAPGYTRGLPCAPVIFCPGRRGPQG